MIEELKMGSVDWTKVETTGRVWLTNAGEYHDAWPEFLAEQGLRLIVVDSEPEGEGTLHFFNPQLRETVHIRIDGVKSLLSEAKSYLPEADRWIELLVGPEVNEEEKIGRASCRERV